jgi:hypothetical protein
MSEPNYDQIRARIQARFNKRKELFMHLSAYVMVNVTLWALFLTGIAGSLPVLGGIYDRFGVLPALVVSIGWGIGVFVHYLDYYYEAGGGAERRESAIQDAIEREQAMRNGGFSKPKRDHMRLTEDGEIEAVEDDDEEAVPYEQSRKRR